MSPVRSTPGANANSRLWEVFPDRTFPGSNGWVGNEDHQRQGLATQHNGVRYANGAVIIPRQLDIPNGVVLAEDFDIGGIDHQTVAFELADWEGTDFVNYAGRQSSGGGANFNRPSSDGTEHIHWSILPDYAFTDKQWSFTGRGPSDAAGRPITEEDDMTPDQANLLAAAAQAGADNWNKLVEIHKDIDEEVRPGIAFAQREVDDVRKLINTEVRPGIAFAQKQQEDILAAIDRLAAAVAARDDGKS